MSLADVPRWRGTTPAQDMRLLVAFAVQPFVAAAMGFVTYPLLDYTNRLLDRGVAREPMQAALSIALGAALAAFFVTLCAAVPAAAWFLKRGPLTLRQTLLSGILLGNLPLTLIALLAGISGSMNSFTLLDAVRALCFGSLFGLAGAAAFWAISRHAFCLTSRSSSLRNFSNVGSE